MKKTKQKKEHGVFTEHFRRTLVMAGMNARKDSGFMFFLFTVIILVSTILLTFLILVGEYGINQYADHLMTAYPGFPATESIIVFTFTVAVGVTQFITLFSWAVIFLYCILFALSEREANKDTVIIPNGAGGWDEHKIPPTRKRTRVISGTDECSHCGSVHTRPAGKEHDSEERYCMTCRKFY